MPKDIATDARWANEVGVGMSYGFIRQDKQSGPRPLSRLVLHTLADHFDDLSAELLQAIPREYIPKLRQVLHQRKKLDFHAWKRLTKTLPDDIENGHGETSVRLLHTAHKVAHPVDSLEVCIRPLLASSQRLDFVSHLRILGTVQKPLFGIEELMTLAKMSNLAVLEIYRTHANRLEVVDTDNNQVNDRLLRGWSEQPNPFPCLRVLRLSSCQRGLTDASLEYASKLPALDYYEVVNTRNGWWIEPTRGGVVAEAAKHGWTMFAGWVDVDYKDPDTLREMNNGVRSYRMLGEMVEHAREAAAAEKVKAKEKGKEKEKEKEKENETDTETEKSKRWYKIPPSQTAPEDPWAKITFPDNYEKAFPRWSNPAFSDEAVECANEWAYSTYALMSGFGYDTPGLPKAIVDPSVMFDAVPYPRSRAFASLHLGDTYYARTSSSQYKNTMRCCMVFMKPSPKWRRRNHKKRERDRGQEKEGGEEGEREEGEKEEKPRSSQSDPPGTQSDSQPSRESSKTNEGARIRRKKSKGNYSMGGLLQSFGTGSG